MSNCFYITLLVYCFDNDTGHISSISDLKNNEDYLEIVRMGKIYKFSSIRAILECLKEEFTFTYMAIADIIGDKTELPTIPEDAQGKLEEIRRIYLNWGVEKGYINGNWTV